MWIFFVESQTLSFILYFELGFQCLLAFFICVYYHLAISARMNSHISCIQSEIDLACAFAMRSHVEEAMRSIGSKLICGTYFCDTRNDGSFVVSEVFALLENSTINRQSIQSFWK